MQKEVKKHVAAVRISDDIGLLARKTWNILLLNAYEELLDKDFHKIKVSTLCEIVGCNTRNFEKVDGVLDKLISTKVKWDIGGGCTEKGTWIKNMGRSAMLASAIIENGVISYEFSKRLSKLLYNPDMYQKISVVQQRIFKSSNSLALWENCIRFAGVGKTGLSEVDEWRELLGVTSKTYDQYKDLNKKILSPAIKEINAVSNIQIELVTKRTGRSITHIGFTVKQKQQTQLAIPEILSEIKSSKEFEDLLVYGINEIQAMSWIQEYGYLYIREKIDYVNENVKSGKVKTSASGLLTSAIKGNYKDGKQVVKEQNKKQSEEQKKTLSEEKIKKLVDKLTIEFGKTARLNFIASLSEEEKTVLETEIMNNLGMNKVALSSIKKNGLQSPFASFYISQKIDDFEAKKEQFLAEKLKEAGF